MYDINLALHDINLRYQHESELAALAQVIRLLLPGLETEIASKRNHPGHVDRSPSGPIVATVHLAYVIRFFAGGSV